MKTVLYPEEEARKREGAFEIDFTLELKMVKIKCIRLSLPWLSIELTVKRIKANG